MRRFLDTLFPDRCVWCGIRGSLVCDQCIKKIAPAGAPVHPFMMSVFAYHDPRVKKLIWFLKYRNARRVARLCAPAVASVLTEFIGEEQAFINSQKILLVPIPLSKKRMKKRGYNQAEILAREVVACMSNKTISLDATLLKKVAETTPQADIKKKHIRLINLGDCFTVSNEIQDTSPVIILIDDVTTTGATLVAARRVLRAAGFRKVYALTVAH